MWGTVCCSLSRLSRLEPEKDMVVRPHRSRQNKSGTLHTAFFTLSSPYASASRDLRRGHESPRLPFLEFRLSCGAGVRKMG